MVVLNLVVGADSGYAGFLGFRLLEDEWHRLAADLYDYVDTERLSARPAGEYVLGYDGGSFQRHQILVEYFMQGWPRNPLWTSSVPPYDVRRREITINAPVHQLEPILADPNDASLGFLSRHAYPTSHYNTALLPQLFPLLLTGNHTGLPEGFPSVLWDLCCSWLLHPPPPPGSSHQVDYDAWRADCVTTKSVVRICQDLGPNCLFTWRGRSLHRCSVCRGVAKARSNVNSRKRRKATAPEPESTALIPVSSSASLTVPFPGPRTSRSTSSSTQMSMALQLIEANVR
jgi:hypothetical protein